MSATLFAVLLASATDSRAQARDPDLTQALDTDGDGLPDAVERFFGTATDRGDTDGDGLSDADELTARVPTNPHAADTDGDGICDGPIAVGELCRADADAPAPNAETPCGSPSTASPDDGSAAISGTHVFGCGAQPLRSPPWALLALGMLLAARRRPRRSTTTSRGAAAGAEPGQGDPLGGTQGGATTRRAPREAT